MNRLWIWISLVIVSAVLITALFPFAYREITRGRQLPARPAERIPPEDHPQEFRESIERRIWYGLSRTILVGAVVALIAGIFLTRWLVAPLRQLEEGARAISKGQLEYRVPIKGSAEMQSVAGSFNQMAQDLDRQSKLRRDMLADVTHELRHPVHVLLGGQQAILDGVYPLSMEEVDRLLGQTRILTSLVDDLHELALAESNELSLHKQDTNLVDLVYYTTEAFQPLAASSEIALKSELPTEPVSGYVDASRIRQVLQNLLVNAMGYTPEGGEVNISLETGGGNYVVISVRDNGRGIAPEELERVFDRFYKTDRHRSRELPGAGLGLAICKALVENHGGKITVESPGIDSGSTFIFTLPLQMEEGESDESGNQGSGTPETDGEERV
jgi:two-component system sensor histidine kinase BaeS